MADKRFTALAGSAFALSLLMMAPANADMFNDWDADNEVGISENEFREGFDSEGMYGAWDADRDGLLSEEEFEGGMYGYYDENEDGLLDENEFANYEEEERGFWDI